jgi:hypothetical protein
MAEKAPQQTHQTSTKGGSALTSTEKPVRVYNPDKQKVYHCWHYCLTCKEPFRHSQASCDFHKGHDYVTFPMNQEYFELDKEKPEEFSLREKAETPFEIWSASDVPSGRSQEKWVRLVDHEAKVELIQKVLESAVKRSAELIERLDRIMKASRHFLLNREEDIATDWEDLSSLKELFKLVFNREPCGDKPAFATEICVECPEKVVNEGITVGCKRGEFPEDCEAERSGRF